MVRSSGSSFCVFLLLFLAAPQVLAADNGLSVDPRCKVKSDWKAHQLVRLADGSLLTLGDNKTLISKDEGETWRDNGPITDGKPPGIPQGSSIMVRTKDGTIVIVYMDMTTFNGAWDKDTGEPLPGIQLDVWCIRSIDEGKTWIDRRMIFDGYCGAIINMIETRDGHLVVPLSSAVGNPGRHTTVVCVSADVGKTWQQSNILDLGGNGDHDGACEGTVAELSDGRLFMLIRTSLDRFWEAFSDDHGLSWREFRPGKLDASSAPGYLLRLQSGRLVLFWNRLYAEGKKTAMRRQRPFTLRPASWHRSELSMAFSEDDCKTWTKPTIIVRGQEVAYAYVFEARPGEMWINFRMPLDLQNVRVTLREQDFLRDKSLSVQADHRR